jgi:hypothetical protein
VRNLNTNWALNQSFECLLRELEACLPFLWSWRSARTRFNRLYDFCFTAIIIGGGEKRFITKSTMSFFNDVARS